MLVTVYRSSKKEGMYLYLVDEDTLTTLPDAVKKQLGEPERALEFELTPDRTLPNADPQEVLEALKTQGFYIQMPQNIEDILAKIAANQLVSRGTTE